jgi:hypothetical protein
MHRALRLACFVTCLATLVVNVACGNGATSNHSRSDFSAGSELPVFNATVYYTSEDTILGYSVQSDGTLQPLPNSPYRFATQPYAPLSRLRFSPDNSFAIVQQTMQFSDQSLLLKRDAKTGVLTRTKTSTADLSSAVFSDDGQFLISQIYPDNYVYRVDESSASTSGLIGQIRTPNSGSLIANPKRPLVYVYSTQLVSGIQYFPVIDAFEIHPDGTLTEAQPPQELHPGAHDGNAYDIAIDRTGEYAIVDRNRAELYVYRLGDDGSWTLVSSTPVLAGVFTGYTYASTSTDTIYVTNMFKQNPLMISYRLNRATGALERQGDISVNNPAEIAIGNLQQSSDGSFLYETDRDGTTYIFSLDGEGNISGYKTQLVPGLR